MSHDETLVTGLAPPVRVSSRTGWVANLARRGVHRRLERLQRGLLHLVEGESRQSFGEKTPEVPLEATVYVDDPAFFRALALGGSVGAGEAYRDGLWRADDLTAVIRILALNRSALEGLGGGLARLTDPLRKGLHGLRRNSRKGSRRNIEAHYDLGNAFYSLFLDETMSYSCGLFPEGAEADPVTDDGMAGVLELASTAKLDLICRKLELAPGETVLEIGTGWGGFAVHAARHYGCRVVTTTISREQFEYASERVLREGLGEEITVLFEDYRDLGGSYDKLVSVEMIEAVGEAYLDRFFEVCSQRLKPQGMMLLQAIVISDQLFERYRRGVDFIQRHVFPGCFLPSVGSITERLARVTNLRLFHLDDITPHYATTLRLWRKRFLGNAEGLRRLGFDDRFLRLWEFYFRYCEGGFEERVIGDVQMLLTKPMCRRRPLTV
jgi:cyclopropane-fatty-acyl-phospholipid synthase